MVVDTVCGALAMPFIMGSMNFLLTNQCQP